MEDECKAVEKVEECDEGQERCDEGPTRCLDGHNHRSNGRLRGRWTGRLDEENRERDGEEEQGVDEPDYKEPEPEIAWGLSVHGDCAGTTGRGWCRERRMRRERSSKMGHSGGTRRRRGELGHLSVLRGYQKPRRTSHAPNTFSGGTVIRFGLAVASTSKLSYLLVRVQVTCPVHAAPPRARF